MIRAAVLGAVIGADVSKSRSPVIHQAAFRALGVAGSYVAHSVTARGFAGLVARLRADGYRYLNVTIPHKAAAAALATGQSAAVRAAGAANTLIFGAAGRVRAENTDGAGLLAALRDLGVDTVRGATVVMVGAGGAAAGAVEALTAAGARVRLVARRPRAAAATRARLPVRRRRLVTVAAWNAAELRGALDGADVLVSAVPAAAWDNAGACGGLDAIRRDTVVLEMAYGATATPLARAVRGRAGRYADGLGMLVHQAAVAVQLALGTAPPLPPMFRAARTRP